jgi:4-amino-4-deoxy-L-arabinose transferase-like glycosyltransferase
MWGPLLHFTEAAWALIFPSTRTSLLLLMAAITASTAFLVYAALADEFGALLALAGAVLFVAIPSVQHYTGMIMADGLVALLDFCAAMAFGRYLNTRKAKHALLFSGYVCLSILTKGNGVALVLLPGFAMLFRRDFSILKLRSFWVAVAIIGGIAGPWQYYSARALLGIADRHPGGWMFFLGHGRTIVSLLGLALCPVIAIGIYERLIAPAWKKTLDGKWASAGALICSVWVFHSLMPGTGPEVRYLIALIPPLLLFLIAGTSRLARSIAIPGIAVRPRAWGFAAIVIAVFLTTAFWIPRKLHYGFDQVAELIQRPEHKASVVLISSAMPGAEGEGMLISEVAMREHPPSMIILRATKMLSQSDWLGGHYVLLDQTSEEVMKFLKSIPVGIVVIHNQRGLSGTPDHRLLQQAIATYSADWERLGTYGAGETTIDVYRMKSAAGAGHGKIRINLPYTLGRPIEE